MCFFFSRVESNQSGDELLKYSSQWAAWTAHNKDVVLPEIWPFLCTYLKILCSYSAQLTITKSFSQFKVIHVGLRPKQQEIVEQKQASTLKERRWGAKK